MVHTGTSTVRGVMSGRRLGDLLVENVSMFYIPTCSACLLRTLELLPPEICALQANRTSENTYSAAIYRVQGKLPTVLLTNTT